MKTLKKQTLINTINVKLRTPWIWLMVLLIIGLTILFSLSQKPQMVLNSQYIKSMSDFQLQESRLMRSLDHVRVGMTSDSVMVYSQAISLREMAVSFAREMDNLHASDFVAPTPMLVARFEREVLNKVAVSRRYLETRQAWFLKWRHVNTAAVALPAASVARVMDVLDSARAGFPVVRPQVDLPPSFAVELDSLLAENADLSQVWTRLNGEEVLVTSEEFIQFFQMANLNEISMKSKVPLVFYFLSVVLFISTFFFIFRSKQ